MYGFNSYPDINIGAIIQFGHLGIDDKSIKSNSRKCFNNSPRIYACDKGLKNWL